MSGKTEFTAVVPLIGPRAGSAKEYLEKVIDMGADSALLMAPYDNICRSLVPVKRSEFADDILHPVPEQGLCDLPSLELIAHWAEVYRKVADMYKERGIDAYYWFCHSIGHGGDLSAGEGPGLQNITGIDGEPAKGCYCPLDARFREYLLNAFRIVAGTKTGLILIDDDFRLNYHMPGAVFGCFCPAHIKRFNKIYGMNLDRESIARGFMENKEGLREKWSRAAGSSLLELARDIEAAVHSVSPETRIGLATAMTHWSTEGVSAVDIAKALAGNTRPYIRTFGAPYHAREVLHSVGFAVEYSRAQLVNLADEDIEVVCEGDTFPHTRFFTSGRVFASYMYGMKAAGFERMLNYCFPFSAGPYFEPGYIEATKRAAKKLDGIGAMLEGERISVGIKPLISFDSFPNVTLREDMTPREMSWGSDPVILKILPRLGIPVAADGDDSPVLFAGCDAQHLSDGEIKRLLRRGAIIDAAAALWLFKRGFDIGLDDIGPLGFAPAFEEYSNAEVSPRYAGEKVWLLTGSDDGFFRLKPKDGAKTLSLLCDGISSDRSPASFVYEGAAKERVMVLAFDLYAVRNGMQTLYNYARAEQMKCALDWVTGYRVPYMVSGPDIYCIAYKTKNDDELMLYVQNLSNDACRRPEINIGRCLPKGDIRYYGSKSGRAAVLKAFDLTDANGKNLLRINTVLESGEFAVIRYRIR